MTTTHDHTNLFTTLPPYPNEIPFTDFDLDLDLSLNDVFATGMLESQAQHWDLNLDMPGKSSSSGVFPVPNDFGFNYPVELGGMGLGLFEGEGEGVIARYGFFVFFLFSLLFYFYLFFFLGGVWW